MLQKWAVVRASDSEAAANLKQLVNKNNTTLGILPEEEVPMRYAVLLGVILYLP
jgi:hypothetical protein